MQQAQPIPTSQQASTSSYDDFFSSEKEIKINTNIYPLISEDVETPKEPIYEQKLDINIVKACSGGDEVVISSTPNRGKRWLPSEEEKLTILYRDEGLGVTEVAITLGRTQFAIVCRLVYLGLISDIDSIKGYTEKVPEYQRTVEVKGTGDEILLPEFLRREKQQKPQKEKKPPKPKDEKPKNTGVKHPSFTLMITKALESLCGYSGNEWGSLNYIKKYLQVNYKIDPTNTWINRTIASMLQKGVLRCADGRKLYSLTHMNLPQPLVATKTCESEEYNDEYDDDSSNNDEEDDSDSSYEEKTKPLRHGNILCNTVLSMIGGDNSM